MNVPVFYTNLVPFGWRGVACYWFILIKPEFKGDAGLHAHERVHISRMRQIGLFTYFYKYFIVRDKYFRAYEEFIAFKYGSGYHDAHIIEILVSRYGVSRALAEKVIYCDGGGER
jgi:hypothetical protein